MVRKRIAAVVALSLVGVVPAGMAWADHKGDHRPPACDKQNEPENNPHCDNDSSTPGNGHHGGSGHTPAAPPTFVFDSHQHTTGRCHENRCLNDAGRVRAIEEEADGDDFRDGGTILEVTQPNTGTLLVVSGSEQNRSFTVDAYNGNGHVSRHNDGTVSVRVAGQKIPSQP